MGAGSVIKLVKLTGNGFGTQTRHSWAGLGWQRFRGAVRAHSAEAESLNALRSEVPNRDVEVVERVGNGVPLPS